MKIVLALLFVSGSIVATTNAADVPADVLDLTAWKLTLPVDTARAGSPDEVKQPELNAFSDAKWFFVDPLAKGVAFRAACGADTTKNSKFPRSELREMQPDGKSSASWGTNDGLVHTLTATLAIAHTPEKKKHVVCAQIHDADDDLIMIRLEGTKLFVERKLDRRVELAKNYQLGQFFDLKIEAADGHVRVWYDGTEKLDWPVNRRGCYFKAGCYTQSNLQTGDMPAAYGEVIIRKLAVTHAAQSLRD
ncbi:Alginate lyase precursor [Anatilimnocola aggregata]|uniref:Alginate lyase n=1 Tax=Anatilimnocola aggregata TaxID=2528021 RepID=A0A517Y9F2_9BACT|nr:polysaccharide lyase family 7 protein [Anatilimnocola aggregata]QDU26792.1 Alginate lyase precursor [Anatilimnocola aggregata]